MGRRETRFGLDRVLLDLLESCEFVDCSLEGGLFDFRFGLDDLAQLAAALSYLQTRYEECQTSRNRTRKGYGCEKWMKKERKQAGNGNV